MKVGDLVKFIPYQVSGVPLFEGPDDPRIEVGVYLGEKTYDKTYTCSLVLFLRETEPKSIQTNLVHPLNAPLPAYARKGYCQ